MRRVNRRLKPQTASRGRMVLFLAGGVATAILLVVVLTSLEQRSPVQSAPPVLPGKTVVKNPPDKAPSPVPSPDETSSKPAPETFTFYDSLEQPNPPNTGFPSKAAKPSTGGPPAVTPSPPSKSVPPKPTAPGYTIQIAAIRDRPTAEALAERLRKKGYSVFVVPHTVPNQGTWYRVRVGHFKQREAAQDMTKRLSKQEGLKAFVARE